MTAPANNATYTAAASVTLSADADALYNPLSYVSFYTNGALVGTLSNAPYAFTTTGLAAGSYALTAVAVDGSGLAATSAVVNITVAPGTGQPYGLTNVSARPGLLQYAAGLHRAAADLIIVDRSFLQHARHGPGRQPHSLRAQRAVVVRQRPESALLFHSQHRRAFARPPNKSPTRRPTPGPSPPAPSSSRPSSCRPTRAIPTSLLRLETRLLVRDTNGARLWCHL